MSRRWENPPSPDTVRAQALMADPGWQRCVAALDACAKARSARFAAQEAAEEEAQRAADIAVAQAAALAPLAAALATLKQRMQPRKLPRWKRGVLNPRE